MDLDEPAARSAVGQAATALNAPASGCEYQCGVFCDGRAGVQARRRGGPACSPLPTAAKSLLRASCGHARRRACRAGSGVATVPGHRHQAVALPCAEARRAWAHPGAGPDPPWVGQETAETFGPNTKPSPAR